MYILGTLPIFTKAPGLIEQVVDGEMVVLDKDAGLIHQLNNTASFIWQCLDSQPTIERLTEQLANAYSIEIELARTDVESTLHQLQQQKLIKTL